MVEISVVIPTRNRPDRLISLLADLDQSTHPINEVIIVDSSDVRANVEAFSRFKNLNIIYRESISSVCIQRNTGIRVAQSPWIFICDDDIGIPPDYLQKIAEHISWHPEAGAVSGLLLQEEKGTWTPNYSITSTKELLLKSIFGLGIWGEIKCKANNTLVRKLTYYYNRKGNHISRAGWPVITNFSSPYVKVPVYGLGASIILKEWLLASPYDEVLDPHGIGDNYGVSIGFPSEGIHLLTNAFVYHHRAAESRLQKPHQYFRRMLALDYFIRIGRVPPHVSRLSFVGSLLGNTLVFALSREKHMLLPAIKTFLKVITGRNPYVKGAKLGLKRVQPVL